MANNCNVLMKEAFDNYLGIDMRYKLDDTLAALGKQKLNATQLEGYLLKQGVSPKEIKQAGILENFRGDSRAFSGEDWLSMSGNQQLFKNEKSGIDTLYSDITLSREGMQDTNKYTETITSINSPKSNVPPKTHFSGSVPYEESILGWRRTHVQDIDGKKTLVLNEIQSDWAQTERARNGVFSNTREGQRAEYAKMRDRIEDARYGGNPENLTNNEIKELEQTLEYFGNDIVNQNVVADFPMAEIKHHQFQIVGAIDDALKQGIDTIAIPIQREGADLQGTEGVTQFYENLNKKILPDLRSKLEKQGLKIKVDKTPYTNTANIHRTEYGIDDDYVNKLFDIDSFEALKKVMNEPWYKEFENSSDYPFVKPLSEASIDKIEKDSDSILENLVTGLIPFGEAPSTTKELWKLTVEEIPNKPVKWDVYGLIGALGLSSMLAGEANAEELKPGQVSISPKTNQQTQQQPRPIMEQMTTQPEVIEQPRQQMDEGFSLRKLLESDKLAPEVDEQSTASLFEQLGLVKKDDLGNYRVNKDIDEDSKVDMRKQMPKTIQDQEGEYLTTHRPTKKSGWTIGRGYDSTGRKLQDIINDFAKAGISQQKAIAFFKHKPISINSTQSKALGDIAWQEKVKVAKSIGLPMEELDKDGFLKVMSLVYRGDIVKGGDGYRGRLYNYAKNGNIKAIDRFINTEARNMEGGSVLYNRWKKFN